MRLFSACLTRTKIEFSFALKFSFYVNPAASIEFEVSTQNLEVTALHRP